MRSQLSQGTLRGVVGIMVIVGILSFSLDDLLASPGALSAEAVLTSRWARPRQGVELLVTVRHAQGCPVVSPVIPPGLNCRSLKPCQKIQSSNGEILLYRYRIASQVSGDYEIPSFSVNDNSSTAVTRPLFLKVSNDGKPHPMTAKELGIAASIPETLASDAVKLLPAPAAIPSPSPEQSRASCRESVFSHLVSGLRWIWDYPGKTP